LTGAYQSRESVEFVIDHVLTAKPLEAACRQQVIEDSLKAAPQAKAAWPNVAMREDITEAVASIDVPTIVISGELDQVDRVATLQAELLPRIPHAAMHVLPGTGHLSPLEAPAKVAQVIARSSPLSRTSPPCAARPARSGCFRRGAERGRSQCPARCV
jgi:pimeloyl-ACP methyl ester carboxylesterase